MPDVASVGGGRSARYVLHKRRWFAGHLASMGSARPRASDERWPLFSGRKPGRHGSSSEPLSRHLNNRNRGEVPMKHLILDLTILTAVALGNCLAADRAEV